jgi:hypothetical protein
VAYPIHPQTVFKVLGVFVAVLVVCMLVTIGILVIFYRKTR